ncbi:MAG TPA: LysR substrate-binding domain-containing protein, partial [Propylenella sp.]|nr:LysR substrate-binding domain-containing protein [Propylenella sp.]
ASKPRPAGFVAAPHESTGQRRRTIGAGLMWSGGCRLRLHEGPTQHPALERRRIDEDRLVFVKASHHPDPPEIEPGRPDLRAVSWIIREAGSGTRAVLEDLAEREGLTLRDLRVFLVLPGNEAVREAVEAGAGATIISEHVVAAAIAAGRLTALPIQLPAREFALVRHRDRHPSHAQQDLLRHLTKPPESEAGRSVEV